MTGAIAAIIIAVWFYKSALDSGKNPVAAVVQGFIAYFIPAVIWTLLVTPGLRDTVEHEPGFFLGFIVRHAYAVVGVICAAWVRYKLYSVD